jgi:hypothetical protein
MQFINLFSYLFIYLFIVNLTTVSVAHLKNVNWYSE